MPRERNVPEMFLDAVDVVEAGGEVGEGERGRVGTTAESGCKGKENLGCLRGR